MTAPVLIIGSMALDDLHLPTGSFENVVGGAAVFAGLSTGLYTRAQIVGIVGQDFPDTTLRELEAKNIDTLGVEKVKGKTFKWAGKYSDNLASRETLDTQLNVFADFHPRLPEAYRSSPYVLLGNIHPALQLDVLGQLENPGFVAADTMNFWIDGQRDLLLQLLKKIDCLIINDEELRQLSGIHNIRQGAQAVLAMGPRRLIVKRGEHGALSFDGEQMCYVPSYPLEAEIDPTGAGDTFAGAFLGRLAELGRQDGSALRDALLHATATASFCVEGVGTERFMQITRAEVNQRIAELRQLVQMEF